MARDPLLLGLDLGTSRIKALLMDGNGAEVAASAVATPFDGGEMSVERLLDAVGRACHLLAPGDRERVAGVGIAGLAESGAPLAPDGRALAPIIAWNDPRGAEVVERLRTRLGPELERSIGQPLRTVSSVAKLGWLVEHGTGPVDAWLGVPELVLQALTGCRATEYSLAARTGAYDVRGRRWLPEVVAELGLAAAGPVFPPVAAAGDTMGQVTEAGAQWAGLAAAIPVTLAGHDHLVGMIGAGVGPRQLANSVGTAETVVASLAPDVWPDVDLALSRRVSVTLLAGGKGCGLLTSAVRSGLVVAAVAEALGCSAGELDRGAGTAGTVPVSRKVIDAAAAGEAFQLPPGAPGAVWNGVLAALSERTWEAVDRLQQVAASSGPVPGNAAGDPGASPAPGASEEVGLVVFGGGSRSRPWLEAKARARPGAAVWRSPAAEAVARGAALLAGVAAGWWPTAEGRLALPLEPISLPSPVDPISLPATVEPISPPSPDACSPDSPGSS